MAKFIMEAFGGELPAIDNRLLPDNHASEAVNTWLLSGRIEPIHSLTRLHKMVNPAARSFFRLPIASPSVDNMIDSYWLEFENQNVRVIKSPVTGQDDNGRYYWADGVAPRMMTGDMIAAGSPSLKLGIPQPLTPPGVVPDTGSSSITQDRAYTYTYVSALGEEGPPSEPTVERGKLDDIWHITVTGPTPAQAAERNLVTYRIYRSVTSVQGIASFFFVVEQPLTDLTYDDTLTDAQITLNEQLQTLDWFEPPFDLQGLVSLPNGMIAGWRFNEIWFCEPYQPHAWPLKYMIAVPDNIVGLGVLGQTVMVLTEGSPWAATGVDPSHMALAIIQPLEPCTARLSIVNTPNGVIYCSPNGLINITAAGAQNVTKDMILKDQWGKQLNLRSVAAAMLMQAYYAYSITDSAVFQEDAFQVFKEDGGIMIPNPAPPPPTIADMTKDTPVAFQEQSHFGTRPGVFLSLGDQRVALNELDPAIGEVQNIVTDIFNGEVMILRKDPATDEAIVSLVDIRQQIPNARYRWRSKMFKTPYLANLGAAKVYWTPPYDAGYPPTVFRMFAGESSQQMEDGLPLRFESPLVKSGQMFRLPSGYKALYWQFEIEGFAIIDAMHVASTPRELRDM